MNAKNEKSKQLYLHALADVVEEKIQIQILSNKGLRNSLFDGVKLDRNAFLQSNGKYISFTKTYQFRPGGSVAKAEKSWFGKALTALGIDLDTFGSGNVIDMIGGVVAGKLLVDGSDKFGGLYKSPSMRMRLNLHHRGGGNTTRLPYKANNSNYDYVNKGAWWEEDAEVGKMQYVSPYYYDQNWTPEAIGPSHSLNPRTGQWERPKNPPGTPVRNYLHRFGRDWEGKTDRERALSVHDDFWWLDPNFKDLTKLDDNSDKKDDEPINDVSDVSATDAATLASERKKKKRKKGQGGRELGDTTKRGGVSEQLYPGQPSPNGFPDTPPPKLAPNGYHPKYGKKADRYRKLDPISAKTMSMVGTDDPQTNKQVAAAAADSKPKKLPPGAVKKYAKRNVVKKESNNFYTRSRKYIDMKRVKELREEKIKEQKIHAELEYVKAEKSKYIDWRKEVKGLTDL